MMDGTVGSTNCTSARADSLFHPECTRSQQDLQLTGADKLTFIDGESLQTALFYFKTIANTLSWYSKWQ